MKKFMFVVMLSLTTLFFVPCVFAGLNMQEGEWEITSKVEMAGMPFPMPPISHIQCLTKKDLVPHDSKGGSECDIFNVKEEGNKVVWQMKCSGQGGTMTGKGEITYNGDTFHGVLRMAQDGMKIITTISGRRIGDCKK